MKTKNKYRISRGFTLIELLVVVTIIIVLMGLGLAVFGKVAKTVKKQQNTTLINQLSADLQGYKLDFGSFPVGEDGSGDNSAILFSTLFKGADPDGTEPDGSGNGKYKVYATYLDPDLKKSIISADGRILDAYDNPIHYLDAASHDSTNGVEFDLWSFGEDEINDSGADGSDDIKSW